MFLQIMQAIFLHYVFYFLIIKKTIAKLLQISHIVKFIILQVLCRTR